MKTCLILRGAPGAGKSTWLAKHFPAARVFSADALRLVKGRYVYDPATDARVHDQCLRAFLEAALAGEPLLAVDNTNVRVWELAPYYRAAQALGYAVEVVWLLADPEECARRTVHGVPPDKVRQLALGAEPLPPWWKVRLVWNAYR